MTRAEREGAVDVGNAAAGKVVFHAFEDAGDGHGIERWVNENSSAT